MSITVLILQACDSRLSSENCRFMLHNGSHGSDDTSLNEFQESAKESGTLTDLYYRAVHRKTNITKEQLIKLCTNVSYFGADIACGYGLIDGIVIPKGKIAKKRTKNATK
jgi:ATP-dependent protease ClpP protease subunit